VLTNLVRAGLARVAKRPYAPLPTVYDGLFPRGTLLTAPVPEHTRPMLSPEDAVSICRHMNDDHADSILGYARDFAGISDANGARMTSIDPSGMDIEIDGAAGPRTVRIAFDHELRDSADARDTLIAMATSRP
jgi:putative heme iron utilization protein